MKTRKEIRKKLVGLNLDNYNKCPKCGSSNVRLVELNKSHQTDYLHRNQSYASCNDCKYSGAMGYKCNTWSCAMYEGKIFFTWNEIENKLK